MGNEITVKLKTNAKEFCDILRKKSFKEVDKFSIDDTFFIPKDFDFKKSDTREILSKALLVRKIVRTNPDKVVKVMIFKKKDFDESGNIINQEKVECDVLNIEDAKQLLNAIGYKEIMNIYEEDIAFEKDGLEIAVKDIRNGDNLIEVEFEDSENDIEKIKEKVEKLNLPIYTDNYFVKKAEIELDKVLNRNLTKEKSCGCIIIEDNKVLLIKQTKGHWGFPKGHVENGETEIETAIREVKEETNIDIEIINTKKYVAEYTTDKGNDKQVVFYVARKMNDNVKNQQEEVSEIKWFDFKEALETVTYDSMKELLKELLEDKGIIIN